MADKRKDSRGYLLRTGEAQRKDGRYSYSYTDRNHKRQIIYGKDLATLRKKEKDLEHDLYDGINPQMANSITVNQVFDKYMSHKHNLKGTTKTGYLYMYNHFVRDNFGRRKIATIKYSDVVDYYYSFINEKVMKASTVEQINTLLHPTFQLAVRDGIIRVNPSDGVMNEIKRSNIWDKKKRESLTVPEQKAFMSFLYDNPEYYGWRPVITVLLGTGMRIGECLGLRWEDLDFEQRTISVNHTLAYRKVEGKEKNKLINTPKTESGTRTIPMLSDVYDAFLEEYSIQKITGFCTEVVDGYSGFVFASSSGTVLSAADVNKAIHRIITDYNNKESKQARIEKREPLMLPDFSAHYLRHTFCTRFCENETNVKVIQTIMGHKDIQTTLDVYTDATEEKKKEVIYNMENKILIR